MAKYTFSRNDIQALCDRLEAKAWSPLFLDMPETRKDLRSAAGLLKWFIEMGVPVRPIDIDILNGTLPHGDTL